ncbi:MAG: HlyD family efflux transporter periplasmic adaptor subunit [Pseudomonadota bacterium]
MDIVIAPQHQPLYRKYWYLIACVLALLAVAAFISRYRNVSFIAAKDSLLIEAVQQGPMTVSVRGYGKLTAKDVYWVVAKAEGQVETVSVKAGNHLRSGDVLVQLSNARLMQQLKDAQLEYDAQQAELNAREIDYQVQLMGLQTDVANAEVDYQLAKMDLDAKDELMRRGPQIISRLELERAVLTVGQYRHRWETQQQYVVKQQEAMHAQNVARIARLQQVAEALANAQQEVDHLSLHTPVDGIVQEMHMEVGQNIRPGDNITRIAQADKLRAEIRIPELQVNTIRTGMKALVDTRTSAIHGVVSRIDPAVVDGAVLVDIELIGALPPEVRPDLNIEATIEISHIDNTVFVKRPVFARDNEEAEVFRLNAEGDIAEKIAVQYGQLSSIDAQIMSGLAPGDRIIVSDTSTFNQHDRVLLR